MDFSMFQDDAIVAEWTLSEVEQGEQIDLPLEAGDWSRANEIRAEIFLPEGVDDQIYCTLTSGHRTEGMSEDDGYHFNAIVSPRGGNIWRGWREFRFPAECFYTRGIPSSGWGDMSSGEIRLPAGSRIRNVRLIQRRIVQGPRMTDDALIAAVDLSHAGLEAAIGQPTERPGLRQSRRTSAPAPSTGGTPHPIPRPMPTLKRRTASSPVTSWAITGPTAWTGTPNPYGYIEWSIIIHAFYYFKSLELAWEKTRDPKYVKGIEAILCDWMRKTPLPVGVRAGGLAWGHSLIVSMRGFNTLVDAFTVLCDCPETEDRTILDLLKSVYEHAVYLLKFESFPPSNKTISEGRTLLATACSFPEFREAEAWYDAASRRLVDDMNIQVMPDGASYELTPGYQISIASWFLDAYKVAGKFGRSLDPELEAGIRRMYDWCVSINRPDFSCPSISDAGSLDGKYGGALADPGAILDDESAAWIGSGGEKGSAPAYTSIARRDSGYFVMRSGWDRDARYLLFEGGPYGRFHQHEDMLSFDLFAHGLPFIVDPGITSYYPNAWTSFYRTTEAHNTVLVDGCGQNRRARTIPEWVESARDKTVWRSDDRSDVAIATYDAGYAGLDASVAHRRIVMFVKPDYFLIFDELTGEGRRTYEALFHFMPYRVLIDPDTRAVRTGRMNPPNLEILPLVK